MLAELLIWAGTQATRPARQLGYAKAAVSLWSRRRRWAREWAEHEANTRDFALMTVGACRRRDTLWLLGAGTLADLPLAELSALFRHVLVFDIALLPQARAAVKRWPNVELRLADVTGIVGPLSEWRLGMPLPIPSIEAMRDLDPVPPDCVLSLNLLSQLPLLPMDYVQRQGLTVQAAETFGRAILQAHLHGLLGFDCPVGLVADARRIWRNRAGEVVLSESAVLDVSLPAPEKSWFWPVAPRGEIDNETGLEIGVEASRLNTAGVTFSPPAPTQ
ncbi:MAG: hypothetical protein OJJ21_19515 [Ferrovibrio sp.]|uniref:hypothetical protein n=1 Tax=Ferrovibrio sp. TaxID=1917215 RepID=UPI002601B362|nr:hypothetical protein [Ferrovibrio sp.]MCW0235795.1 hypothetical protein [Ferrovibrio sp.]